jgi:sulfate permease, SulP family
VATIGSMFQGLAEQLPTLQWPTLTWDNVTMMLMPAMAIALLGGVESLLSALVADTMTGKKHHSNRELIGQGMANVVTPLFGGIPATGAIARTATNIRQGATSPVAGMVHAIFVLLVMLLFADWADHIPLASMAPILIVVAWKMSERKQFLHILKTRTGDSVVLCATFLLTIVADLTVGVATGLALAALFFVVRMSKGLRVKQQPMAEADEQAADIHICTFEGPIFFGSAKRLHQVLEEHQGQKVLILCMHRVPYIDTTGEAIFSQLIRQFRQRQTTILVSGTQAQPTAVLRKTDLTSKIGAEHFFLTREEAIAFAKQFITEMEQSN